MDDHLPRQVVSLRAGAHADKLAIFQAAVALMAGRHELDQAGAVHLARELWNEVFELKNEEARRSD